MYRIYPVIYSNKIQALTEHIYLTNIRQPDQGARGVVCYMEVIVNYA